MGVAIGLLLGTGLLLMWSVRAFPRQPRPEAGPSLLRRRLDEAGLRQVGVGGLLTLSAVLGLVCALALQVLSGTPTVAVAFGVLGAGTPWTVVSGRARRRQRELAEVWPDAVDNLASGVRAGLSLAEALAGLADRGPEPLRVPFAAFAAEYAATARFDDCLDRLKQRLADPVGDRVVEGIRVAREVGGGDLGRLLRSLSGHLRDDARTRAELEARQSWAVNGARLAVASPWLVLLTMSFQRDLVARYASAAGAVVLVVGGLLCLLAYRVMLRIGRLPTERRVLA